MIQLFTVENDIPQISAEAMMIKEFKDLIRRDRGSEGDADGRKKFTARKELAFVYFFLSDSRFEMYNEEERIKTLREVLELPSEWSPDEKVWAAIDRYKMMLETRSSDLVKQAREALDKLRKFLQNVDLTETTKSGSLLLKPKDVQSVIDGIPTTIEALQKAEKLVKAEREEGGSKKELGMFEKEY